jgi:hypothetical protein
MSTNRPKRLIAGGAIAALAAGSFIGLTAVPANAAGLLSMAPTTGSKLGSLTIDDFSLSTSLSALTTGAQGDQLVYKLTDPDQGQWLVTFEADDTAQDLEFYGAKLGGYVNIDTNNDITAADGGPSLLTDVLLDFEAADVTSIIVAGIRADEGASHVITVKPVTASSAPEGVLDGGSGSSAALGKDDGGGSITVQSWLEEGVITSTTSLASADANASTAQTLNFYDPGAIIVIPRVEQFVKDSGDALVQNDSGTPSADFGISVQFNKADLNLNQLTPGHFNYKVENSSGAGTSTTNLPSPILIAGDSEVDDSLRYYTQIAAGQTLAVDIEYVVSVRYETSSSEVGEYAAAVGYTVPATTSTTSNNIAALITDSVNSAQTSRTDVTPELRAGTKAFTFKAQVQATGSTTAIAEANTPVLAVVQAGSFLSTGGGYTVTGTNTAITSAKGVAIAQGFTDSKGEYSVTVTSANANKDESYTVSFYALKSDDTWSAVQTYTNSYDTALGTVITPESSVLSGASVTANITITDQFGQASNLHGTKALSVRLRSSNTTSVDKDLAVASDGTVSFTFDNYVLKGSSDVMTVTLFTGSSVTAASTIGSSSLSLYNVDSVSAVQVPTSITGNVTYVDFIADGAKAVAGVTPAPDNAVPLTGSVVDAGKVGVPGAPVTISGAGLQFLSGTKYYNDTVDVVASSSGIFTVDVFSHSTNATGQTVTITSGGVSSTTLLKTYLPTGIDGKNLSFSIDLPSTVVMNKTYAVSVQLTDKWGNPVQTSKRVTTDTLSILGTGSVEINSSSTAVKKEFNKAGQVTVFVRSVKDIAGPGAIVASLQAGNYVSASTADDTALSVGEITTDVTTTVWDETLFTNEISTNVEVFETEAEVPSAATSKKVNAGSFKGYVALYALGYEGQRMSAKVGNDWVIVPSIPARTNDLFRAVEFVGAGVEISVRLYIDRVLVATIPLLTK